MGEQNIQVVGRHSRVAVNTFAGRIHVEWDPDAAVTTMGQLPFFIEFLKVSGLYDAFVAECPLRYTSQDASPTLTTAISWVIPEWLLV